MIKNIFFDLDGTLLNMNLDEYLKLYFSTLYNYSNEGYKNFNEFYNFIREGVSLIINNNGEKTNKDVFYDHFKNFHKDKTEEVLNKLENYYLKEFDLTKTATSKTEYAPLLIKELKEKGYNLILATNPFFPRIATQKRIKWAGLNEEDFSYISTYENSHYAKPNIKYYEEIIEKLNLKKEECIMIGNDTSDDYAITKLDIPCIILKDNLINKNNLDIDFTTLKEFYYNTKNYPKL